jgi:hypothetical protein
MLEKLKITPGPWEYLTEIICINDYPFSYAHRVKIGNETLTVTARGDEEETEQVNNTRLIAAAPEMLEVLIGIGRYQECNGWDIDEHIMPIIEKATGRTWEEVKELINEAD